MYNKTRILVGPALEQLALLPDNHFHTIITSPPYWGLRSYKGDPGMIGMEPTWGDHVQNLLAVFRECRRVLRDDGTFWLNYGDAFATKGIYLKPKNLMMMPARLAIALQDDGWILRSEVIWHKPNPTPESAKDRPTCSHEKIFLFSKNPRYFYDHVAVRVKAKCYDPRQEAGGMVRSSTHPESPYKSLKKKPVSARKQAFLDGERVNDKRDPNAGRTGTANLRNVWPVATQGYKEAHFATYPPKLIIPCIKAGTSEKGCCPECGSPHERAVKKGKLIRERINQPGGIGLHHDRNDIGRLMQIHEIETVGWQPDCDCDADTVPCRVLDPFGGSGTTAMVANRLQRDATIIEISPDYADMAAKRISDDGGFLVDVVVEAN